MKDGTSVSKKRVGEFSLIDLLSKELPDVGSDMLGIGDDCAIISPDVFLSAGAGSEIVLSKDLLVDGRHFDRSFSEPADIGWKAIAVNASDVAAMGGRPKAVLVGLMVSDDAADDFLQEVYRGLSAAAMKYGVCILGGDTVSSPAFALSITVVGAAKPCVRRSGGEPGNDIWVSGSLGGAAAGLRLLSEGKGPWSDKEADAIRCHRRPEARIPLGEALAECGVTAMLDVSDGLLQDLGHILKASSVSASIELNQVPLHGVLSRTLEGYREALTGGDDYELLFAASPEIRQAIVRCGEKLGIPLSRIGALEEKRSAENSILLMEQGKEAVSASQFLASDKGGFSHF